MSACVFVLAWMGMWETGTGSRKHVPHKWLIHNELPDDQELLCLVVVADKKLIRSFNYM
jgi:hypothetical protein